MPRLMLSNEHWLSMRAENIYDKSKHRLRVGYPWRDLPDYFGQWNTVYKRFNDGSSKDKLMKIFQSLVNEPDLEWAFIDGSIVKAHQHSVGAVSAADQGIGDSRGGKTTKIHMAVNAFGLPVLFMLTGGQVHDCKAAPVLIEALPQSENVFAHLKHFRSIATRYDKLKRNYQSMLALACSFLWLSM